MIYITCGSNRKPTFVNEGNSSKRELIAKLFYEGRHNESSEYHPLQFRVKKTTPSIYIELQCEKGYYMMNLDKTYGVRLSMLPHTYNNSCPCAFDEKNTCRYAPFLCQAAQYDYFCSFEMKNIIITKAGGLLDCETLLPIIFDYKKMFGIVPKIYRKYFHQWRNYYITAAENHRLNDLNRSPYPEKELMVMTRMAWDNCFNHISFQTLPMIGIINATYGHMWDTLHWHTSLFTAAVLRLLGVRQDHIVIDTSVIAKRLLWPWLKGWCPSEVAALEGVAMEVRHIMTANLLAMPSSNRNTTSIKLYSPDWFEVMHSAQLQSGGYNSTHKWKDRVVVYMSREPTNYRAVINEELLLGELRRNLRPELPLYVLGLVEEAKSIDELHASWGPIASLFHRAILIIGPHGGSFNNMVWLPDDAEIIEFNEYPDTEPLMVPVRSVFLSGAFALGLKKFWIVHPEVHKRNLYIGKMKVSLRELFRVLQLAVHGELLRDGFDLSQLPMTAPMNVKPTPKLRTKRQPKVKR